MHLYNDLILHTRFTATLFINLVSKTQLRRMVVNSVVFFSLFFIISFYFVYISWMRVHIYADYHHKSPNVGVI